MSVERRTLQRLSDEQVANRLAAYNGDGGLERDLKALWTDASDLLVDEQRRVFGEEAANRVPDNYGREVDSEWVQRIAGLGRTIYSERTSVPAFLADRNRFASAVIATLFDRFVGEQAKLESLVAAFHRVSSVELDIILAQVALLESIDAANRRGSESSEFERDVTDLVRASADQTKALSDRTRATAASARGMLGKTSEVAAAAEQSAVAMREAAQTAAGLIRAIEDARAEVEVAADVATRAGDQCPCPVDLHGPMMLGCNEGGLTHVERV